MWTRDSKFPTASAKMLKSEFYLQSDFWVLLGVDHLYVRACVQLLEEALMGDSRAAVCCSSAPPFWLKQCLLRAESLIVHNCCKYWTSGKSDINQVLWKCRRPVSRMCEQQPALALVGDQCLPSFQVPQRTTSISPALARKNSPGNGSALGPRLGSQPIRARYGQHLWQTGVILCWFFLQSPGWAPRQVLLCW